MGNVHIVELQLIDKKNEFEIDHFLYEKAPIFATKKAAGYMGNLILSCHDCNHNKNSFWIEKEEIDTLNPDGEKLRMYL